MYDWVPCKYMSYLRQLSMSQIIPSAVQTQHADFRVSYVRSESLFCYYKPCFFPSFSACNALFLCLVRIPVSKTASDVGRGLEEVRHQHHDMVSSCLFPLFSVYSASSLGSVHIPILKAVPEFCFLTLDAV